MHPAHPAAPAVPPALWLTAGLAVAAPTLLAYSVSPSPTFLNQALALALWALWVLVSQPAWAGRALAAPLLALALMAAAALWSWLPGGQPASLALSALGLLAAAALLLAAGAGARARSDAALLFAAFCWAALAAGLLNAVLAAVQVFAPGWCDGTWLAASGIPGRAVGNLRQPNHLSSVLTWACIAVIGLLEMRRLTPRWAAAALALLVAAVVLTASRTGLLSVLLLALWGLADRRLGSRTRLLLLATPLLYGAAWWGLAQWSAATAQAFGGAARLAETDISGSRFGIWANTLALIRQQPWTGVGWGEFNFAWTLTPFPQRPTAFFDHAHNLPLQLLAELGLPLGGAVLALLLWGLARAVRLAFWRSAVAGDEADAGSVAGMAPQDLAPLAAAQRCAVMAVVMIGLHSLLEYPLWYAYFLLPTAWLWGFALQAGAPRPAGADRPAPALAAAGVLLMLGTALAVADYRHVTRIFKASPGAAPLEQRIDSGRESLFFAHHADYAAATAGVAVADTQAAFDRATHYLLDTRLMTAWARFLADQGRTEEARHLAQRLREFRKPESQDFFSACEMPTAASAPPAASEPPAGLPFQCTPPQGRVDWRSYLPR